MISLMWRKLDFQQGEWALVDDYFRDFYAVNHK